MRPARDELKYINTVQVLYQMQMYDDMCSGVQVAAPRRAGSCTAPPGILFA